MIKILTFSDYTVKCFWTYKLQWKHNQFQGANLLLACFVLLKVEVSRKGHKARPQMLSGICGGGGGVCFGIDDPAEDHSGWGELWTEQAHSVFSHQPQLQWDESWGTMEETLCEGERGASEESITVCFRCSMPFVLFLAAGQEHAYTRAIFPYFSFPTGMHGFYALLVSHHITSLDISVIPLPFAPSCFGSHLI